MSTIAIDYIWQAILESERSDDIRFMDDEFRIRTEPTRLPQPWLDQSGAVIDATLIKP
jgi:hypothetical protein